MPASAERDEWWEERAKIRFGNYFCCECLRNHRRGSEIWESHLEHALTLPEKTVEALSDATMDRQKPVDELIGEYVERGLERDLGRPAGSENK